MCVNVWVVDVYSNSTKLSFKRVVVVVKMPFCYADIDYSNFEERKSKSTVELISCARVGQKMVSGHQRINFSRRRRLIRISTTLSFSEVDR